MCVRMCVCVFARARARVCVKRNQEHMQAVYSHVCCSVLYQEAIPSL